jgi:hypothetical protein
MTDTLTGDLFANASEETVDGSIFEGDSEEQQPTPESPYKGETKKPDRHASRVSGESILGYGWIGLGSYLVNKRIDPPVGRVLQLQAPLAGKAIDDIIAGTFIDRILQPIFAKSEQLEGFGALIALPILVGLIERKPEMAPMVMGPLHEVLGQTLIDLAPTLRKKATKQRAAARAIDLNEAFDIPRGADPIEAILQGFIFQDIVMEQEQPVADNPQAEQQAS